MNPARWQQIKEVALTALELEKQQRASFLDRACGSDAELRQAVEALLEADDQATGTLEGVMAAAAALPPRAAAQSSEDLLGRSVSHYKITEKLGEGGMGVVYKAQDTRLERTVALKFLASHLLNKKEAKSRFLREAKAAAALDHPNICTIYEVGEADGKTYLSMAYIDGESLEDRIERGPLPMEELLAIGRQVAEGLEAAHEKGVVHRDIKPANIMLTRKGQVKIMDFGLAYLTGSINLTKSGTSMGTPAYMSPEQAQGQPMDRRTDIWSLGVVLYEMATGRRPFHGEHEQAVLYLILNEEPAPITGLRMGVPVELDRIVGKTLTKDPSERYQHVEDLLVDLRALGEPGESRGRKILPARRALLRRRSVLKVGVPALAFIAAISWWGIFQWPRTSTSGLPSVAVLPLVNISEDSRETDYLAYGISQAVTSKLTQVGFRVTPWESAKRYSVSNQSPEALARQLNVDAILTGTFQITGTQILASVALVEGDTGLQVWADEIPVPIDNLFEVQLRIATGIAERLKKELTGQEAEILAKPASRSVAAYDFYLQGSYLIQEGTQEATKVALEFFNRAVQLDPDLEQAHVGLGTAYYDQYFNGWEGSLQSLDRAQASFQRALDLNSASMRARRGMMVVNWERGLSENCLIQGREAARLGQPNDVETILAQAWGYLYANLNDRGLPLLREALRLDPVNESANWGLVVYASGQEKDPEAVRVGESYINRFGDDQQLHFWIGVRYQQSGNIRKALEHYEKASGPIPAGSFVDSPLSHANYQGLLFSGLVHERLGESAHAQQIWRRAIERLEPDVKAFPDNVKMRVFLACFYGVVGEQAAFLAQVDQVLAANINVWELYYLAAVLARTGETRRASDLLIWITRQGRIRADLDWFFELIASTPAPWTDSLKELLQTQERRLREMY